MPYSIISHNEHVARFILSQVFASKYCDYYNSILWYIVAVHKRMNAIHRPMRSIGTRRAYARCVVCFIVDAHRTRTKGNEEISAASLLYTI